MVWFGRRAEDKITGFVGRAIGYCQYNTGCNQILIAPEVAKGGEFRESHWFDEQRIRFLPGKAMIIDNGDATGPDAMAPTK